MNFAESTIAKISAGYRNLSNNSASKQFRSILQKQIDDIKTAGTYKNERIITSSQSTTINVKGSQGGILNFCANNYLGLSVRDIAHTSWCVYNLKKSCNDEW